MDILLSTIKVNIFLFVYEHIWTKKNYLPTFTMISVRNGQETSIYMFWPFLNSIVGLNLLCIESSTLLFQTHVFVSDYFQSINFLKHCGVYFNLFNFPLLVHISDLNFISLKKTIQEQSSHKFFFFFCDLFCS